MAKKNGRKKKQRPSRVAGTFRRQTSPSAVAPAAARPPGTLTITAYSLEQLAVRKGPRFPPPMRDLAEDQAGWDYWWSMLGYAFDMKPPAEFPLTSPIPTFSAEDDSRLQRYIDVCEKIARSTALNSDAGMTVSQAKPGEEPTVTSSFSPEDAEAGFTAYFRQLYDNDTAGFNQAMRILIAAYPDETMPENAELRVWGKAAGRLRGRSVIRATIERLAENGEIAAASIAGDTYPDTQPPEQAISERMYAEQLHWNPQKVATVQARHRNDAYLEPAARLEYMTAAAGLSHLYMGFAEVVRRVLGASRTSD